MLHTNHPVHPPVAEQMYGGPQHVIPKFIHLVTSQLTRLHITLKNLLPSSAIKLLQYQIRVDHLKLEEAKLRADAYLHSTTPYSDTMAALRG